MKKGGFANFPDEHLNYVIDKYSVFKDTQDEGCFKM